MAHTHHSPAADAAFDPSDLVFLTREVSPPESAAVAVVLRGLMQEESDELRARAPHGQNAWQVSQRSIRSALTPGPGRWRGFLG